MEILFFGLVWDPFVEFVVHCPYLEVVVDVLLHLLDSLFDIAMVHMEIRELK